MSNRIFPTVRQIVWSTLTGIASHPRIASPQIYYPVVLPGQEPEEMKIQRYRTYDGIELQEPGLTCAVFPAYSSRTFKLSPSTRMQNKSAMFEPYTLGSRSEGGFSYQGTYQLIVQLYYQDVAINESLALPFNTLFSPQGLTSPHGFNSALAEGDEINNVQPLSLESSYLREQQQRGAYVVSDEVLVEINPGEEILREYLDLLRLVLDDMPTMRPWSIRSSCVKLYDFPTSSWNRENTDIYFHTAWLLWELVLFPPASWRDIYFMPATGVSLDLQQVKPF